MRRDFSIGGRYELGGLLGSGGMGSVYRARDTRLGREVAVKVLGEHHAGSAEFVERFEREVRSVASLDHPNIVRVFDSGTGEDGSPYMAMELVDGGTLKDRILREGPLPPREAARVALQVADALGAAHAAGIVHRDVKPENVLLMKDGRVKVADFGIARATEATAMTRTSMILGTAPYLSPEQARGESVGPASDLYSLGVVLYEGLTGRTPFGTGEHVNPLAIAMKHCTEPAPSPRATNREVPRALEAVTLTLMRKRPDERHASAAALAEDLAAFLRGERPSSPAVADLASSPEGAGTQALGRAPTAASRRRRKLVPVMAVALAGFLGLAFSPLVPMQRPVAFVEGTVAPDTGGGLDRAASPVLVDHPGAPETPAEAPAREPEEERARASLPERRDPAPRPQAAANPPPETDPASASADATASAAADASAAPSSAPADSSPKADAASATAAPETPGQAPEPAPPSSVPATEEAPVPDQEEPAAESAPSSPVPASEPAASASAAPAAPAASSPPDEVEVPEIEVPEVEVPDF